MARPEDIKKKKKKAIEETPHTYVEVDLSRKNEMVDFLQKKNMMLMWWIV